MDNGLIFPYPRRNAHDEPICANCPLIGILRVNWLVRGNLGGSSQAMG